MEMAHVLFMDIVAYSMLPMDEQRTNSHSTSETPSAPARKLLRAQADDRLDHACPLATAWRSCSSAVRNPR